MNKIILMASALALTACQAPMPNIAKHCEGAVLQALTSPGSYDRQDFTHLDMMDEVWLTFDSQNGMGGLLRNTAKCQYQTNDENQVELASMSIGATEFSYEQTRLFAIQANLRSPVAGFR